MQTIMEHTKCKTHIPRSTDRHKLKKRKVYKQGLSSSFYQYTHWSKEGKMIVMIIVKTVVKLTQKVAYMKQES